jgi:transposase
MDFEQLLPRIKGLRIWNWEIGEKEILFEASIRSKSSRCPLCSVKSVNLHSSYARTVADLPWAGRSVRIRLTVRKFFCRNSKCRRDIFSERLGPGLEPYQRRTGRLRDVMIQLCQEIGGEGGARMAEVLGIPVSADTLIRIVMSQPEPCDASEVKILGVDDWAFRKGHDYGTILVDLERNCPIDLLPERSAESFETWLKQHPEVEVISRDRASCYSKGGRNGAPQAVQVADRWHLLKNLGDTTQRLLAKYPQQLKAATDQAFNENHTHANLETREGPIQAIPSEPVALKPGESVVDTAPKSDLRRRLTFVEVKKMQARGLGIKATARELGISRTTVRKYRAVDNFPERARPVFTKRKTDPFIGYLLKRWNQGERNGNTLWREIKALGFDGTASCVYRVICNFSGYADGKRKSPKSLRRVRTLSARQAARIFSCPQTELKEKEQVFCDTIVAKATQLEVAHPLILRFVQMVREGRGNELDNWLCETEKSGVNDLHNFSKSLRSDYEAVKAALVLPWSNGQVEGQVNRLKTIKRSMYGRSRFELLKRRFIRPP